MVADTITSGKHCDHLSVDSGEVNVNHVGLNPLWDLWSKKCLKEAINSSYASSLNCSLKTHRGGAETTAKRSVSPTYGFTSVKSERLRSGFLIPQVLHVLTSKPVMAIWCMESLTDLMMSSMVANASSSSAVPSPLLHFNISWNTWRRRRRLERWEEEKEGREQDWWWWTPRGKSLTLIGRRRWRGYQAEDVLLLSENQLLWCRVNRHHWWITGCSGRDSPGVLFSDGFRRLSIFKMLHKKN